MTRYRMNKHRGPKTRGAYGTGGYCPRQSRCKNAGRRCDDCLSYSCYVEKEAKKEDG